MQPGFWDETQPVESEHSLTQCTFVGAPHKRATHIMLSTAAYSERALCSDRLSALARHWQDCFEGKGNEYLWLYWGWVQMCVLQEAYSMNKRLSTWTDIKILLNLEWRVFVFQFCTAKIKSVHLELPLSNTIKWMLNPSRDRETHKTITTTK